MSHNPYILTQNRCSWEHRDLELVLMLNFGISYGLFISLTEEQIQNLIAYPIEDDWI